MAFADFAGTVNFGDFRTVLQHRIIGPESHGTAQIAAGFPLLQAFLGHPFGDQADHRFRGIAKFGRRCRIDPGQIAGRFDTGHLHAQADTEKGNIILAGKFDRSDLAFAAPFTKATGYQYRVERFQLGRQIFFIFKQFRIQPAHLHLDPVGQTAVEQRFLQRFIGVLQPDIFADHADDDFAFGMLDPLHDIIPARQIRFRCVFDAKGTQNHIVQTFLMILQRYIIDIARIESRNHRFLADIAELGDLGPFRIGQRMLAAAQQDIRLDAQRRQFPDAVLGRLGFQLTRGCDIGHQGDMNGNGVVAADLVAQLANRLDERQALDITDGPANLAQHEINAVELVLGKFLDGVGHVRNHLHRGTEIVAAAFLGDDRLVNPARGHIVGLQRWHAGKALIMTKIEVGLRPVIGDIDFAVLIGRHRARINVEIGVKFPDSHGISASLQKRAEACRHQTFAKRGNHTAGNENISRHGRRGLRRYHRNWQSHESGKAK